MKLIPLILLCSMLISCTIVRLENLEFRRGDDVTLRVQELEFKNLDGEAVAAVLRAMEQMEKKNSE